MRAGFFKLAAGMRYVIVLEGTISGTHKDEQARSANGDP